MHSHSHFRTLYSLLSVLACAAALLVNAQMATAGFSLSDDEVVAREVAGPGNQLAHVPSNGVENLAAYLPPARENQQIDLSLASTSGTETTTSSNRPTAPQASHNPDSANQTEAEWLTAFSSNSASHGAGTSAPSGPTAGGTPAAILAVRQSSRDLQVTGWLQGGSRLSLPTSTPRTLLRPPRA